MGRDIENDNYFRNQIIVNLKIEKINAEHEVKRITELIKLLESETKK